MSCEPGQDQFKAVPNRRAGYSNQLQWALKIAQRGGTLAAGEGALLVEYYEEQVSEWRERATKLAEQAHEHAVRLHSVRQAYAHAGVRYLKARHKHASTRELLDALHAALNPDQHSHAE